MDLETYRYITRIMPKDIFIKPTMLGSGRKLGFAINSVNLYFFFSETGIATMQIAWFGNGTNKEFAEASYIMPENKKQFIDKLLYHCGSDVIKYNPELKKHAPLIHGDTKL